MENLEEERFSFTIALILEGPYDYEEAEEQAQEIVRSLREMEGVEAWVQV